MGEKFVVATLLGMLTALSAARGGESESPWLLDDWQAARQAALATTPPRPVFVVFRCMH